MQDSRPSVWSLAARDGYIKGIAFAFAIIALGGAAVVVAVRAVLAIDDVWAKVIFLSLLLLIPGLVLGLFLRRVVGQLQQRLAVLDRLADHGVVLEGRLANQYWRTDSEGDSFWTAVYAYSLMGKPATFTRGASWSGTKTVHPESLQLLVDPERPTDAFVLGYNASGRVRIAGLLSTLTTGLMFLWLACWAFLFFGGITDRSALGGVVIVIMVVVIPVLWFALRYATSLVSRR
jgi:hypothetical protein